MGKSATYLNLFLISIVFTITLSCNVIRAEEPSDNTRESINITKQIESTSYFSDSIVVGIREDHKLLKEFDNVQGYVIKQDSLKAILRDGLIFISDNLCAGLKVEDEATEIRISEDSSILVLSDSKNYYIYNTIMCARYNVIPRRGFSYSVTNNHICETNGDFVRAIDIINKQIVYHEQAKAFFAGTNKSSCLFLSYDGVLFQVDLNKSNSGLTGYIKRTVIDTGVKPIKAVMEDSKVIGITADSYFTIDINPNTSEAKFQDLKLTGRCHVFKNSLNILCEEDFSEDMYRMLLNADSLSKDDKHIYILKDDIFKIYTKELIPQKEVYFFNFPVTGCIKNDILYIKTPHGKEYEYNDNVLIASKVPEDCDRSEVRYSDGVFTWNDYIFEYAKIVKEDKKLYKHTNDKEILYFIDNS